MDFSALSAVTETCNKKSQSDNHDHFDLILDPVASI